MWNNLRQIASRVFPTPQKLAIPATNSLQRCLSTIPAAVTRCPILHGGSNDNKSLLNPSSSSALLILSTGPHRGMKIMGKINRRCKGCYLIWEDGILYNRCKTHPRHTAQLKPKYWATQRLMTHATSGFKRPW